MTGFQSKREMSQRDLDTRLERNKYFGIIREMRKEYMQEFHGEYDLTVRPRVDFWANEKYGFQMEVDGQGNYTEHYSITNPKKFLMFKIKYWK